MAQCYGSDSVCGPLPRHLRLTLCHKQCSGPVSPGAEGRFASAQTNDRHSSATETQTDREMKCGVHPCSRNRASYRALVRGGASCQDNSAHPICSDLVVLKEDLRKPNARLAVADPPEGHLASHCQTPHRGYSSRGPEQDMSSFDRAG